MTASELITYIKRDFRRENEDARILQAINDTVMNISIIIPHSNYKFQSYAHTTVGEEDYPLPPDILHLIHPIRLLEGMDSTDTGWVLDHITKEEYDQIEPNPNRDTPSTGRPQRYTIYSRSILLQPIPDKADYFLEINWAKRPTKLVNNSDTDSLPEEYDEVIKWGTLFRCYAGLGMYQEAEFWRSKYENANGDPIGMFKMLIEAERSYEGSNIGIIKNNSL